MIPPILPSEPTHGKINEKVWGIWALQIYIYECIWDWDGAPNILSC